jgi:hypothetical protein
MQPTIPPVTHFDKLRIAAMYLTQKNALRRAAWSSVGWGLLVLLLALIPFMNGSAGLWTCLHLTIGLILLVEGVWIFRTSNPEALLAESAVLLLLGLWNTVGLYFELRMGLKPVLGGRVFIAGILQLISAYSVYKAYPTWKTVFPLAEPLYIDELDHLASPIWKASIEERTDLIAFQAENKDWKIEFLPDYAVVVTDKGKTFELAGRSELVMEQVGETMLSKKVKLKVVLGDKKLKCELKPEYFERYQQWAAVARTASAPG